jgi:flavorubredoxin
MDISLGSTILKAVPAHFLHSEGNFHFYDPVSKILFSGDLGASLVPELEDEPVEDFAAHIPMMEGFHRRYMSGNKVCRYWVNMARKLDIEWLVPQHGRSFKGKVMIEQFFSWLENLECGVDIITQDSYRIP